MSTEIEALIAERDALIAQLYLAKNIFELLFSLPDADTREEISSEVDTWLQMKAVFDATPRQCLLDVQAEAGRLGYIEGATNHDPDYDEEYCAELYAAKVRQGGAE